MIQVPEWVGVVLLALAVAGIAAATVASARENSERFARRRRRGPRNRP